MDVIRQETKHVTGFGLDQGGSGDPSAATAWGVFCAMRALARRLWEAESLDGRHVAIQGVGKVGTFLAAQLAGDGARLSIADVSSEAVQHIVDAYGADAADPATIHTVECDIYSPCALADALSRVTIPALRCEAVAGCANNQLASDDAADLLAERGIVYAPDFVVNAGGVINVAHEILGYDRERAYAHTARIADTVLRVLDLAEKEDVTTARAAEMIAEERLNAARA
jgi:leucine dehydrogenase